MMAIADNTPDHADPTDPVGIAWIDTAAVRANVATIRAVIGDVALLAVVKANGYGHGAVPVAVAALDAGADLLGVADVSEAIELREAGITAPVLAWLHDANADFSVAVAHDIQLGVSGVDQLAAVVAAARARSARAVVHLKVDTGLGRSGAPEASWPDFFQAAAAAERDGTVVVSGLFSHLSNSSQTDDLEQLASFERARAAASGAGLAPHRYHLASTAGAIRIPETRQNLVRIGIGLYGLSPFDDATSADLGLRPVMTVRSRLVAVTTAEHDAAAAHTETGPRRIGVIPLGYLDGIPRCAAPLPVLINGMRFLSAAPAGPRSLAIDLGPATDIDTATEAATDIHTDAATDPAAVVPGVGTTVVLFGDPATGAPAVTEWSDAAGTINYEIVTRLGGRVVREYS